MKPGELHEARIDRAHEAGMREGHRADDVVLEPLDRFAFGELVDAGRIAARVDRAAHQRHRCGLARVVDRGHVRHGGEHRHGRLTDADDVHVGAEHANELDDVIDEVVEIEASHGERDVARVVPVGDVRLMVGQHRLDGAAQQRRVVPRHRRHDQHLGVVALAGERGLVALEMEEAPERRRRDHLLAHADLDAADAGRLQAELGLAVAARDVLEQLARRGEVAAIRGVGDRIERPVEHAAHPADAKAHRGQNGVGEFICVVVHRRSFCCAAADCRCNTSLG